MTTVSLHPAKPVFMGSRLRGNDAETRGGAAGRTRYRLVNPQRLHSRALPCRRRCLARPSDAAAASSEKNFPRWRRLPQNVLGFL